MTGRLTPICTAFAILVHSIFGCCSHHAHAETCQTAHALCSHSEDSSTHSDGKCASTEHNGCSHNCDNSDATVESWSPIESWSPTPPPAPCCPHEDDRCPHGACDEGKCHFVTTSVTETPRPDDGGMKSVDLLSISALDHAQSWSGGCPEAVEKWPDRSGAELCAAPTTQVWRL